MQENSVKGGGDTGEGAALDSGKIGGEKWETDTRNANYQRFFKKKDRGEMRLRGK